MYIICLNALYTYYVQTYIVNMEFLNMAMEW